MTDKDKLDAGERNKLKLFENIKCIFTGTIEKEVATLLLNNGAERLKDFCGDVTHCIVGVDPEDTDIRDASRYGVPIVPQDWFRNSFKCNKLLPISAINGEGLLLSGVVVSFSQLSLEDCNKLQAMVEYYGGSFCPTFNKTTTHLITSTPDGENYEEAILSKTVQVVTPNWLLDSIQANSLCPENLYHPHHPYHPYHPHHPQLLSIEPPCFNIDNQSTDQKTGCDVDNPSVESTEMPQKTRLWRQWDDVAYIPFQSGALKPTVLNQDPLLMIDKKASSVQENPITQENVKESRISLVHSVPETATIQSPATDPAGNTQQPHPCISQMNNIQLNWSHELPLQQTQQTLTQKLLQPRQDVEEPPTPKPVATSLLLYTKDPAMQAKMKKMDLKQRNLSVKNLALKMQKQKVPHHLFYTLDTAVADLLENLEPRQRELLLQKILFDSKKAGAPKKQEINIIVFPHPQHLPQKSPQHTPPSLDVLATSEMCNSKMVQQQSKEEQTPQLIPPQIHNPYQSLLQPLPEISEVDRPSQEMFSRKMVQQQRKEEQTPQLIPPQIHNPYQSLLQPLPEISEVDRPSQEMFSRKRISSPDILSSSASSHDQDSHTNIASSSGTHVTENIRGTFRDRMLSFPLLIDLFEEDHQPRCSSRLSTSPPEDMEVQENVSTPGSSDPSD